MSTRVVSMTMLALAVALAACSGDSGGDSSGTDTSAQADTAAADTAAPGDTTAPGDTATPDTAPADTAVEAETGATPTAPKLTSAHPGWEKPNCLSCHQYDTHNDGLDPYLCAGCHGTNGAPTPPHGVRDSCNGCHGQPHGADGFPDPLACKACHFPQ